MRILHVASEVAPYSKTGGLADVLGALPKALAALGHDVTVVTPRYRSVDPERFGLARRLRGLAAPLGGDTVAVGVYEGQAASTPKVRVYLVDHKPSFDRDGIYGDANGDYADNARRFALLGSAALALAAEFGAWPDVVHGHDWQAGPAILFARRRWGGLPPPKTVFTIHNLAFQGLFPESVIDPLGLPREYYNPEGYEFYGQASYLKAGLTVADRLTTVSPRYAREIQTPEQGFGMDGVLRARAKVLTGILNGCDYDVWNPERDVQLPATYSAESLAGKRVCKAALQRELNLPVRADVPLCGSISRLTDQKGFDLILGALPTLLERDLQYVILGSGAPELESALSELAARHPRKLSVRIGYDEALAHRIEAGCDLYVMPSRFEPCGLNQMYSLRYGTPPIVRATGGLDDTIVDFDARSRSGTGFKFESYDVPSLTESWRRALVAYGNPDDFSALVKRCMAQDFSWTRSAEAYSRLYSQI
ncbi:MAG: glycogen/starch synthase, ADP-glucose type [Myxococcales bacterium]|nr:glycogen/starch synthase, ADP-glucose type [Myxococcales bacterium]